MDPSDFRGIIPCCVRSTYVAQKWIWIEGSINIPNKRSGSVKKQDGLVSRVIKGEGENERMMKCM